MNEQSGGWRRALRVTVSIPRYVLVGIVRFYQRFVSPLTPPTCRYYPSCSSYAATALLRHGVIRGMALAVWRVLRCHPWSAGGVDDVPPARPPKNDRRAVFAAATH